MPGIHRVVITGVGAISPFGVGTKVFWDGLRKSINPLTFDKSLKAVVGAVPSTSDPCSKYSPGQLREMNRSSVFAVEAATEALGDAGLIDVEEGFHDETAVNIGTCVPDVESVADAGQKISTKNERKISPYFVPRILTNIPGSYVSLKFKMRGGNSSTSTACATGASCVAEAFQLVKYGQMRRVIAGAVESCINPIGVEGFRRMRALATEENVEISRPFDSKRQGFVLSEGAGVLVLERLEDALERKSQIYAEVLGFGTGNDAHHLTAPREDGFGSTLCMKRCLENSGLEPDQIGYINAHATSTPVGDKAEAISIEKIKKSISVSSIKGHIGHTLGAAGALETIFTAICVKEGVIVGTRNLEKKKPIPEIKMKRRRPYGPRKKKVLSEEPQQRPLSPVKLEEGMIETAQMRLEKRIQRLKIKRGGNCPICGRIFESTSARTRHIFGHDNALSLLQMYSAERDPSIIQNREQEKYDQILDEYKVLPVGMNVDEKDFIPREVSKTMRNMFLKENVKKELISSGNYGFRKVGKSWTKIVSKKKLDQKRRRKKVNVDHENKEENQGEKEDIDTCTVESSELPPCIICLKTGKSLGLVTVADFIRHLIASHGIRIWSSSIGHDRDTVINILEARSDCLFCSLKEMTPTKFFFHVLTKHSENIFENLTHYVCVKLNLIIEEENHYCIDFTMDKISMMTQFTETGDFDEFPEEEIIDNPEMMKERESIIEEINKEVLEIKQQQDLENLGQNEGLLSVSRDQLQRVIVKPGPVFPSGQHQIFSTGQHQVFSSGQHQVFSSGQHQVFSPGQSQVLMVPANTQVIMIQRPDIQGSSSMQDNSGVHMSQEFGTSSLENNESQIASQGQQVVVTPVVQVPTVVRPVRMPVIIRKPPFRNPVRFVNRPTVSRMVIRHVTPVRQIRPVIVPVKSQIKAIPVQKLPEGQSSQGKILQMLKYQVRRPPLGSPAPSTSSHRTIITIRGDEPPSISPMRSSMTSLCSSSNGSGSSFLSTSSTRRYFRTRSNSLSSLSSLESSDSAEWGHLRVFTGHIKGDTDYKTLKINNQTTAKQIVEQLLSKFRLTSRDPNLYQLWMEVSTRINGQEVKTLLELDHQSRPLELQKCHPTNQSRFVLQQNNTGVLVRIHDSELCRESNYKSVLISPKTTASEVITLVLQLARIHGNPLDFHLFVSEDKTEAQIPDEILLAPIYLNLKPGQKIFIKK
ncbi:hypothetical protein FO519_007229 [Halicephalobus sp. NKZ332]|nr:hypothetical protein FO519_007229 [Halicephalobus sp. NKZ332]